MARQTRQRQAVTDVLIGLDDFRSAQQLHDLLRTRGVDVGLATVYRTLALLADEGAVDVLRTPDGEAVYRRCGRDDHHHHLVCRRCGRTEEIEGPGVEDWAAAIAAAHGFTEVHHTIELTGLCSACPQ